ncbi:Sulfite reductase [NADPH] flavoprotein component [Fulvia fulva]|uniref:assimilatory sulfite reductase (NADPH) n=1 Tax=Passalora fulva TaxID=5499 RepID=A0A9Q8P4F4_PASFU|nr:Sulfite reductase [NADPH] flavoprotein component [Fulvia fulva]KAK4635260.1 Sulfite reductase [NADPH] flavoprotein component [Fulvia fulva]KAK4637368.1 Sulfite reductase [NADPH] flavoprotein component [Fulvia fulva]UJO12677.1 Sulfite reductase [NADPH] flavoprotein component [Fulvia fulva]WPV09185.1 Sulfite reductase [NADPH] flavoprotein component [Fulvia fulva]WPV23379.1 Sulfite reductase [NADPH] flavoprotein component [Fulvia fulva]
MHNPIAPIAASGSSAMHSDSKQATTAPFGQTVALKSISGPTYITAQTLVQQVAYALSDKLFSFSPETFDLDKAAIRWSQEGSRNGYGDVTGVQQLQTRSGAGALALGYMFSPDFDLAKRAVPQSIIASAGSLDFLRGSLDQLSLLYDVANPTALQVAAVEYEAGKGFVTDYVSSLNIAEELGLGLVSSKSAYEVQHMSLLALLMSNALPAIHAYDGITVGRETTRVVDVLGTEALKRTYDSVLEVVREDLGSKRFTHEGKMSKLLLAFNAELGTEYKAFEYHGHEQADHVLVVFGTVEGSLTAQVADALAERGVKVGVINVRIYRPFIEEDFLLALPASAQQVTVLGQVKGQAGVQDHSVTSSLYADVLAAVNFGSVSSGRAPAVYDVKYARETVWTVAKVENLLRRLGAKSGDAMDIDSPLNLTSKDTKQYTFWDVDASKSVTAPVLLGQLLSDDSAQNVAVRTGHDNLVQGGVVRSDIRTSSKSIEAPYSVKDADVVVVGSDKLLKEYNIISSIKEGGIVLLKAAGWKDEDAEKKLSTPVRKAIATKHLSLYVLDPAKISKVEEDSELESYLLQLAFLKLAKAELFESGLKKLKTSAAGDVLDTLSQQLEEALKQVEVPEHWLTVELEENEAVPDTKDLNVNSYASFEDLDEDVPTELHDWKVAAKGLAFKEAYGTTTALRPELTVKTAVATVKEHRRLTPETYDRNIFHIEFDLGNSGVKYEIGEALGIHAENDKTEVETFIKWYGLNPEEIVEVPSREDPSVFENRTVYQAMMQNVDIFGRPPKRFYEALAEFADDDKEKTELLLLGTGGNQEAQQEFKRRAEVDTVTYADVLLDFPSAHPSFHEIVRIVAPMKRREYSIASSQKVTPNSVSLLIVTVNWVDPKGRDRFGQATRYLNGLPVGAKVTVSVKPSVMKLPPKTTQPIIMAGLGTGLAPFRAFVQERAWQRDQGMPIGDVFLYMGSRHQREEYLYGEEWEAYQDAGIITLLGCAFSRDQPQKIYIQDRMRETLSDIRRTYLKEEGAFYLCGPTWPVPDVTNVLEEAVEVQAKAEGRKKVSGAKEIERLKEELRYVLEVY